jgi:catechol 2,3-dioxygenase-like lactoylglutathione lyase family enzyme
MAQEKTMKLGSLQHVNIRCTPADLPAIEKFYGEVLGLKTGYRPEFATGGVWLYDGNHPVVHVSARFAEGSIAHQHNGSVDHIAFNASGSAEFRKRVVRLGVEFEEQNVPNAGYQIFLHDPVGTKLEFNFSNKEAPQTIASGTMAPMQLTT